MDQDQGQAGERMNDDRGDRTPEDVRVEIEATRAELGETVEALAAKTDVKAQATRAVNDARTSVSEKADHARGAISAKRNDTIFAAQQAAPDSAAEASRQLARIIQRNRAHLVPIGALILGLLIGRGRAR